MGAGHRCRERRGESCTLAGAGVAAGRCLRRPGIGDRPPFPFQGPHCAPRHFAPVPAPGPGSLPQGSSRPGRPSDSSCPLFLHVPGFRGPLGRSRAPTSPPARTSREPEIAPCGRCFPAWAGFHRPEPSEVKILFSDTWGPVLWASRAVQHAQSQSHPVPAALPAALLLWNERALWFSRGISHTIWAGSRTDPVGPHTQVFRGTPSRSLVGWLSPILLSPPVCSSSAKADRGWTTSHFCPPTVFPGRFPFLYQSPHYPVPDPSPP